MNQLKSQHLLKLTQQLEIPLTHSTPINWEPILNFLPFKIWQKNFINNNCINKLKVEKIEIQSIDYFKNNKLGFLKFKIFNDLNCPNIVVLRGGSVGILVVIENTAEPTNCYTLLVQQPRLAVADFEFYEIPAGMLDEEHDNVKGKAIEEIQEETGLSIRANELEDLLKPLGVKQGSVFTSPGLLDEGLNLYYIKKRMNPDEIQKMDGQLRGNRNDGELINIRLVPLDQVAQYSQDMKTLFSCQLYLHHFKK